MVSYVQPGQVAELFLAGRISFRFLLEDYQILFFFEFSFKYFLTGAGGSRCNAELNKKGNENKPACAFSVTRCQGAFKYLCSRQLSGRNPV